MHWEKLFSTEMIGVYLSIITLATLIVTSYFNAKKDARKEEAAFKEMELKRKWEVEDREYKERQEKAVATTKGAALSAARQSAEAGKKVTESAQRREEQLVEIKQEVIESKQVSADALNAANNTNQKILEATQIAQQALDNSTKSEKLRA